MANEDKRITDFEEVESISDSDMFLVENEATHNASAAKVKNYVLDESILTEIEKVKNVSGEEIENAISGKLRELTENDKIYQAFQKAKQRLSEEQDTK